MKHGPSLVFAGAGLPVEINKDQYDPIRALGANLIEWWDSSSGITITGVGVSAWVGKKAGTTLVQGTDANRPAYSLTSFNGAPGLTFDGTSDHLTIASVPGIFPTGATAGWVYAVIEQSAATGDGTVNRHILQYGTTAANTSRMMRRTDTGGVNRLQGVVGTGGASVAANDATIDFSGRKLAIIKYNAATFAVAVDNGAETVSGAAVPSTGTTHFAVGATPAATLHWHGKMRDLIFTTALSTAQETSLKAFLLARRRV